MKILHTADWHLGHQLYGHDRSREQLAMLRRMEEIVAAERPDVFLVCGDVFHVSQPSAAVQKTFAEAMLRIRAANPGMTVVVTSGNHDSGSRHEIFRTPWQTLGVEMIGMLDSSCPSRHIVEIPGKGYVVAIPYANARFMPEGFVGRLLRMVHERNSEGLPIVLAAHTAVHGADFRGHESVGERELFIGGIDAVDIREFGEGYDYLALGHIHRPQFVHSGGVRHSVRYSGAPLAVGFDEACVHSVSIVEIGCRGATPRVTPVEIVDPRPLLTLPETGTADWESALRLLKGFPASREAYIRLNVMQDAPLPPDAVRLALEALEGKEALFCLINFRRSEAAGIENGALSLSEFKAIHPIEVARRYIESRGGNFTDELASMLREAIGSLPDL